MVSKYLDSHWSVLQGLILAELIVAIFPTLPNCQIKNLAKFSCYGVMELTAIMNFIVLEEQQLSL